MHKYAPFLLSFLSGILFSNPVYADPPPLETSAGQNKTVDSGTFTITSASLPPGIPAILFANGGIITTTSPLTLIVETPTTGLAATGIGSRITAD